MLLRKFHKEKRSVQRDVRRSCAVSRYQQKKPFADSQGTDTRSGQVEPACLVDPDYSQPPLGSACCINSTTLMLL
ncbi:hypothetical protein MHYP_G00171370 [Metynnis hypsauchen]